MYEVFEHTADLGLRIRAESKAALFTEAARAMFSVIATDLETVQTTEEFSLDVSGEADDYLLFDWLNDLLFQFDTTHLLLKEFQVTFTEEGLTGTARGEIFEPARHSLANEVKAITYHGLRVEEVETGWEAELIIDI